MLQTWTGGRYSRFSFQVEFQPLKWSICGKQNYFLPHLKWIFSIPNCFFASLTRRTQRRSHIGNNVIGATQQVISCLLCSVRCICSVVTDTIFKSASVDFNIVCLITVFVHLYLATNDSQSTNSSPVAMDRDVLVQQCFSFLLHGIGQV